MDDSQTHLINSKTNGISVNDNGSLNLHQIGLQKYVQGEQLIFKQDDATIQKTKHARPQETFILFSIKRKLKYFENN